jgi:hypothetical protein
MFEIKKILVFLMSVSLTFQTFSLVHAQDIKCGDSGTIGNKGLAGGCENDSSVCCYRDNGTDPTRPAQCTAGECCPLERGPDGRDTCFACKSCQVNDKAEYVCKKHPKSECVVDADCGVNRTCTGQGGGLPCTCEGKPPGGGVSPFGGGLVTPTPTPIPSEPAPSVAVPAPKPVSGICNCTCIQYEFDSTTEFKIIYPERNITNLYFTFPDITDETTCNAKNRKPCTGWKYSAGIWVKPFTPGEFATCSTKP